jgi:hypothetical protein
MPNAGGEPRPKAGAQRTLEGVGSSAWLGAGSAKGLGLDDAPGDTPRETLRRHPQPAGLFLRSEAAVKESDNGLDDLLQRLCFQDPDLGDHETMISGE